jgi:hypothetical protein
MREARKKPIFQIIEWFHGTHWHAWKKPRTHFARRKLIVTHFRNLLFFKNFSFGFNCCCCM